MVGLSCLCIKKSGERGSNSTGSANEADSPLEQEKRDQKIEANSKAFP